MSADRCGKEDRVRFIVFESRLQTYRMDTHTGQTWRLEFDKWVGVSGVRYATDNEAREAGERMVEKYADALNRINDDTARTICGNCRQHDCVCRRGSDIVAKLDRIAKAIGVR